DGGGSDRLVEGEGLAADAGGEDDVVEVDSAGGARDDAQLVRPGAEEEWRGRVARLDVQRRATEGGRGGTADPDGEGVAVDGDEVRAAGGRERRRRRGALDARDAQLGDRDRE